MAAANIEVPGSVRGSGDALPFADASFDIVYSSNVAEHMPNPWDMGDEMLRVTRPGGLAVLSYTIWLGPFGGHETGLWQHYIGGNFARNLYDTHPRPPPKNVLGNRFSTSPAPTASNWASRVQESGTASLVGLIPPLPSRWRGGWCMFQGVREFW